MSGRHAQQRRPIHPAWYAAGAIGLFFLTAALVGVQNSPQGPSVVPEAQAIEPATTTLKESWIPDPTRTTIPLIPSVSQEPTTNLSTLIPQKSLNESEPGKFFNGGIASLTFSATTTSTSASSVTVPPKDFTKPQTPTSTANVIVSTTQTTAPPYSSTTTTTSEPSTTIEPTTTTVEQTTTTIEDCDPKPDQGKDHHNCDG